MDFYDLNTKVNFTLGEKDRLYLSGYFGRDVFAFEGDFFDFDFFWGNATGTARWNHVFSPKLFANTTFTFSNYEYNIETRVEGFSFTVGSDVKDATLKTDFYHNSKSTGRCWSEPRRCCQNTHVCNRYLPMGSNWSCTW